MMPERADNFSLEGWGLSLAIHVVAVACAVAFVAQVKPALQEHVFQWDVALVQSTSSDSEPAPAETAPASVKARVSPVPASTPEPRPDQALSRVASEQSTQMVHPAVEPVKPVEQTLEPPRPQAEQRFPLHQPTTESVEQRTTEIVAQKVQPVEQPVQEAQSRVEPPAHTEPPIARSQHPAPAETADIHPAHPETASHSHEAHSAETTLAQASPRESGQPPESFVSREAVSVAESPGTSQSRTPADAPVQVAKVAPSGPEVKADHRWLAESLWRRVAELKRYPASARLHGLEGKVVLKAVIRSNGQLAEVTVQKSSGHSVLDAAAMEAVREACPIEMKQSIAKPEIVVSLPIVYSLSN